VTDNGVGILPDQIGRLFQVFQRLQSRTTFEGTGIGLALCRKIAEHHGGRIWAESAGEGMGSRFCVELPLSQPITSARQTEPLHGEPNEI
jgi:signal transduction histidine kinase